MSKNEKELLSFIEKKMNKHDIQLAAKYINKSYSMFTPDIQLWDMLKSIFGSDFTKTFDEYSKEIIANKFINELLLKYYPCERTLKYYIIQTLKKKKDTVVFEIPTVNSRIDVCRINGSSYAYEIKTEFDNLRRLEKQISDYAKTYEYIYIVVSDKYFEQVSDLVQDFCGIITYSSNKIIKLITKKEPKRSPFIDPALQLQALSSEDLNEIFKFHNINKIPSSKNEKIDIILNKYSEKTINSDFKKVLKLSYKNKWEFIKNNYNKILPIDIQSFFHSSIDPSLIYHHELQ